MIAKLVTVAFIWPLRLFMLLKPRPLVTVDRSLRLLTIVVRGRCPSRSARILGLPSKRARTAAGPWFFSSNAGSSRSRSRMRTNPSLTASNRELESVERLSCAMAQNWRRTVFV